MRHYEITILINVVKYIKQSMNCEIIKTQVIVIQSFLVSVLLEFIFISLFQQAPVGLSLTQKV